MEVFRIRQTDSGCKFDVLAPNGEVVATSEVYHSTQSCRKGIEGVRKALTKAKLADLTVADDPQVRNPRFEMYQDRAGDYRFRLRARNGEIVAFSEPYRSKSNCEKGMESVRRNVMEENQE